MPDPNWVMKVIVCYSDKDWAEAVAYTVAVGSVNVVVNDGEILIPHEHAPVFVTFHEIPVDLQSAAWLEELSELVEDDDDAS